MRVRIDKRGAAVGASAILLLAMAGCATATDTSSTDGEATESTESSAEATEEVAEAGTDKWCSGVKIAAFPGGPQGGVFANNVFNGFKQAEADLGLDVPSSQCELWLNKPHLPVSSSVSPTSSIARGTCTK